MRPMAWGLVAVAAVTLPLAPPAPAGGRSFTITAGGDILIHRTIAQIADANAPGAGVYDFTPMLLPIEPWVGEADLAICHLEGALDPENAGLSYYPLFNAPHEVADALAAAGYDACSTAGNHTLDHGFTGLADTLAILDAAGIRHAGSARNAEERLPSLYEVNGVTVGHLAYTYGTNGLRLPEDEPWAVNLIGDGDGILEDAHWARKHGAEFVVVSMHWGTEYQTPPTAGQAALAERLLASPDIDLILGTHVHVVQPIGRVGGEVVVYGMGNQTLEHAAPSTGTPAPRTASWSTSRSGRPVGASPSPASPTPPPGSIRPPRPCSRWPTTWRTGPTPTAGTSRLRSSARWAGSPCWGRRASVLSPTPWPALSARAASPPSWARPATIRSPAPPGPT